MFVLFFKSIGNKLLVFYEVRKPANFWTVALPTMRSHYTAR